MNASTLFSSTASNIVGVEPMPLVTYGLPIDATGTVPAGTFITITGTKATTLASVFGVLAYDVVTDPANKTGATIFIGGSFQEPAIKAANSEITIDDAAVETLRTKNIYLERTVPSVA